MKTKTNKKYTTIGVTQDTKRQLKTFRYLQELKQQKAVSLEQALLLLLALQKKGGKR